MLWRKRCTTLVQLRPFGSTTDSFQHVTLVSTLDSVLSLLTDLAPISLGRKLALVVDSTCLDATYVYVFQLFLHSFLIQMSWWLA